MRGWGGVGGVSSQGILRSSCAPVSSKGMTTVSEKEQTPESHVLVLLFVHTMNGASFKRALGPTVRIRILIDSSHTDPNGLCYTGKRTGVCSKRGKHYT